MNFETVFRAELGALIVHGRDGGVPLGQALAVRLEVEPGDCDLPRDDGVDGGAAVAHHEQELGLGEQPPQVGTRFERERVLVTQPG